MNQRKITAKVKKFLRQPFWNQQVNAYPLFLNLAAWSGMSTLPKKVLGIGYNQFLFFVKNKYADMNYLQTDLTQVWNFCFKQLQKDKNWLNKIISQSHKDAKNREKFFEQINTIKLSELSEKDFIKVFRKCCQTLVDGVGTAHLIEAISTTLETKLNQLLKDYLSSPEKVNPHLHLLLTPTASSFIKQEAISLQKIKQLPIKKQGVALIRHQKMYYWIQDSYLGAKNLSLSFFANRSKIICFEKNKKIKLPKLSKEILQYAALARTTTVWQDDRRINILKGIHYTDLALCELARRTNMPRETLAYLTANEALKFSNLSWLKQHQKELIRRKRPSFYLMTRQGEFVLVGQAAKKLEHIYHKLLLNQGNKNQLQGTVANKGKLTGRVVVCQTHNDMKKMKPGRILVTAMTRPEFMPAIVKAAGIITDEGGITSHAAVLSRELGIPCIIGTKIATKVLKDGDKIELNANEGTIKKIN